jgi:hypothetical protein
MATARTTTQVLVLALFVSLGPSLRTEPAVAASPVLAQTPTPVNAERAVRTTVADPQPTLPAPDAQVGALAVFVDSADQLDDVGWAIGRFLDAGLELPAGELHMHADRDACARPDGSPRNGYMGGGRDGFELHICTNPSILLHELAHLWDNHAMTDELRSEFLELRGLETWNHASWNQAGGEHLASVIAWGLGGGRPTSISQIDDASLAAAYELLTGSQPPALAERGYELRDGKIRRVAEAAPDRRDAPAGAAAHHDVEPV